MTDDDSAEGEGVYWVVPWDGQGARIYLGNIAPGNLVAAIREKSGNCRKGGRPATNSERHARNNAGRGSASPVLAGGHPGVTLLRRRSA